MESASVSLLEAPAATPEKGRPYEPLSDAPECPVRAFTSSEQLYPSDDKPLCGLLGAPAMMSEKEQLHDPAEGLQNALCGLSRPSTAKLYPSDDKPLCEPSGGFYGYIGERAITRIPLRRSRMPCVGFRDPRPQTDAPRVTSPSVSLLRVSTAM